MRLQDLGFAKDGAFIVGPHRYTLWRGIEFAKPYVNIVMLNPSTADGSKDDPTIRKCRSFVLAQGFSSFVVTNLFAFRTSSPSMIPKNVDEAVGPENDFQIAKAAADAQVILCAWGNHGGLHGRAERVKEILRSSTRPMRALGITKVGEPRHPLWTSLGGDWVPFK